MHGCVRVGIERVFGGRILEGERINARGRIARGSGAANGGDGGRQEVDGIVDRVASSS